MRMHEHQGICQVSEDRMKKRGIEKELKKGL